MKATQPSKITRNIKALLTLGFTVTLVASVGGGFMLVFGYSRASVTQPMWKFGQHLMILGLTNLFIYLCIFFQLRKLSSEVSDHRVT
jgi:hypothetical protein